MDFCQSVESTPLRTLAAACFGARSPGWPARRPAAADFRLCNNTGSRVGIAVGYKDDEGWTTEGWWNLSARSCETLLRGALVARFYYVYAVDYDRGGEWSGKAFMCTRDKEFTIQRHRRLPGARLRPHRLLRGRYRRAALLDRAAHRIDRAGAAAPAAAGQSAGPAAGAGAADRTAFRPRPED